MRLRTWVFIVSGAAGLVAWANEDYVWVAGIITGYVVWMYLRIPIERAQTRAKLPGFQDINPPRSGRS